VKNTDKNQITNVPILEGLLLDLNANYGIELEENDKICSWQNQITNNIATYFVKQDKGRTEEGSGRPTLKRNSADVGGYDTVIFHRQELVNDNENAFDHLVTGSGYSWFSVMAVYEQVPELPDVNTFFGNLRNSNLDDKGKFEGFWGGLSDDNRVWMGTRNAVTFGRWDENNPQIISSEPLKKGQYYVVMGRMGAGRETVKLELFINSIIPAAEGFIPINPAAEPSKMVIGQERDATNHPGRESFDGEISRFLVFERPLSNPEMDRVLRHLKQEYKV
jgi:hypothetical protein